MALPTVTVLPLAGGRLEHISCLNAATRSGEYMMPYQCAGSCTLWLGGFLVYCCLTRHEAEQFSLSESNSGPATPEGNPVLQYRID